MVGAGTIEFAGVGKPLPTEVGSGGNSLNRLIGSCRTALSATTVLMLSDGVMATANDVVGAEVIVAVVASRDEEVEGVSGAWNSNS